MKRLLVYFVVFVVVLTGVLIAFAPASIAWLALKDDVANAAPGLEVTAIKGTLWQGDAQFHYLRLPPTGLEWKVAPASVFMGHPVATLATSGDDQHIDAKAGVAGEVIHFDATGYVDSRYVNAISRDLGLTFTGRLEINKLELDGDSRWFNSADGDLHWNGGQIMYQTSEGPQLLKLPPMDGKLAMAGNNLQLAITSNGQSMLDVVLKPTGWVAITLKVRLFEVANLQWPTGAGPDDTALTLEEKIF